MENSYQILLQFVLQQILEIGVGGKWTSKRILQISTTNNRIYHSLTLKEEFYGTLY